MKVCFLYHHCPLTPFFQLGTPSLVFVFVCHKPGARSNNLPAAQPQSSQLHPCKIRLDPELVTGQSPSRRGATQEGQTKSNYGNGFRGNWRRPPESPPPIPQRWCHLGVGGEEREVGGKLGERSSGVNQLDRHTPSITKLLSDCNKNKVTVHMAQSPQVDKKRNWVLSVDSGLQTKQHTKHNWVEHLLAYTRSWDPWSWTMLNQFDVNCTQFK